MAPRARRPSMEPVFTESAWVSNGYSKNGETTYRRWIHPAFPHAIVLIDSEHGSVTIPILMRMCSE